VIIAEKLLEAFREIEACGYTVKITSCFFVLSGDEGATAQTVYISETDLLRTDAAQAARQKPKLSLVDGGQN
jgi:hypothetical protein